MEHKKKKGIISNIGDDEAFKKDIEQEEKITLYKRFHDNVRLLLHKSESITKKTSEREHVVILIHGILTYAPWYRRATNILERELENVRVVKPRYGRFTLYRFLGNKKHHDVPKDKILRCIDVEYGKPKTKKISIIAHSFGTYLFTDILKENKKYNFNKVVLCGSIVKEEFDWHLHHKKISTNDGQDIHIVNEVGQKDRWPKRAKWIRGDRYGASGRYGFEDDSHIFNRYHDLKHSEYFNDAFILKYWVPFIENGYMERNGQKDDI